MAFTTLVASPPLTTGRSAIDTSSFNTNIQTHKDSFLPKFKSCKNLQQIKQLHGLYTKYGLIDDPSLLTKLIAKYSQTGSSESLEYAKKAFTILKIMSQDRSSSTIYLYNSLIRGNSLAGNFHDAILLYVDMLADGVGPDNYTFPFVLSACTKNLRLSEGKQLHCSAVKMGYYGDVFVSNSLVHCYGECGETDSARKVFDEMSERNVVSWTSLICGYVRREWHEEAVSLFFQMIDEGIEPSEVTMVSVISACAKLGNLNLGERVLDCTRKFGISFNAVMINALVDLYMKCGAAEKARQLFDECVDRNLVLYNTFMSNCVKVGKTKEAVEIFRGMIDVGPKPDRVTMLSVITCSAEMGDFRIGMQCHAYVVRNGIGGWDSIGNSLIDMYTKSGKQELACRLFDQMANKTIVSWNSMLAGFARNGDLETARRVFNEMPERDIVSWNTLIGALVQESFFTDAIELFHSMQKDGVILPDEVTMVSVVSACGYLGSLDLAKWTYRYIEKYGIKCNVRLCTALVDMFARCGDPQSAMKVFSTMKQRDVSAWTAAIGAMAMEGNGEGAVDLFREMLGQEIKPDEVVFTGVLTACSHGGLVKQGRHIFNSMKEHGITPHIVHYGCVVDLLGRAGLLEEALDFITRMPIEPNAEIWSAFLGACRTHKNEKMATQAHEMITKSGRDKIGIHVLLSNIYASAGKWSDVARVRMGMKERGMKKIPGSSSIEVSGVVHEFTSGDESHASMLEEINSRLRDEGYLPDLSNVLIDTNEDEKELLLSRHGEKVAIAFGLISLGRGMPVRVVKNLRMCSDCHSFAKMVSKVYDREIVVRDNNRFHFFSQGLCSCCDYW